MGTPTLYTKTPTMSVHDNRGLAVRVIQYNRADSSAIPDTQVTHTVLVNGTSCLQHWDPRLFTAKSTTPNLQKWLDLAGKTLRRESTDSGMQGILYDAEGCPVWQIDSAETISRIEYDLLGRPTLRYEQMQNTTERILACYIYGDNDSQTTQPQDNNLRGQCVRQYDEGGKLTQESIALSGALLKTSQQFLKEAEAVSDWQADENHWATLLDTQVYSTSTQANALGAVISQTNAVNHTQTQAYDVSGMLANSQFKLQNGSVQTLLSSLTYSAAGQPLVESTGNGIVTTYEYQPETQRLSGINVKRTAGNALLQNLTYAYDAVGNITSITDSAVQTRFFNNQATTGARAFSYDALYQLTSATGRENVTNQGQDSSLPSLITSVDDSKYANYTRNYVYDRSGNMKNFSHTGANAFKQTMAIDANSNRSVKQNNNVPDNAGVAAYFDANGNLQKLKSQNPDLIWNGANQLQTVIITDRGGDLKAKDREIYQYRDGMRVRKQTRTCVDVGAGRWKVEDVRYLPGLELRSTYQETVAGNTTTASAPTESLQVITAQAGRASVRILHWTTLPAGITNDQVRYSVDDQIGSLVLELDSSGQVISREEYYPYGGTAVWAARSQVEADYKMVRYSGKERDNTGLYYYGYRYYAPWLCRWLNADPAREVDGLNLFQMVKNNPILYFDPLGAKRRKDKHHSKHQKSSKEEKIAELANVNLESINADVTTVYRMEVMEFNEKYSHVFVEDGNARIYSASDKPTFVKEEEGRWVKKSVSTDLDGGYYYESQGNNRYYLNKVTPSRKEGLGIEYGRRFLENNKEFAGMQNMIWLGFNTPERARDFYVQKTNNENAKGPHAPKDEFVIKTFDVPSWVFHAIAETAIYDQTTDAEEKSQLSVLPLNGDVRHAPNQMGLKYHHSMLINEHIIKGTANLYRGAKQIEQLGYQASAAWGGKVERKSLKSSQSWSK